MKFEIGQEVFLKEACNNFQNDWGSWVNLVVWDKDPGTIVKRLYRVRPTYLVNFHRLHDGHYLTVKVLGSKLTTTEQRVKEALLR